MCRVTVRDGGNVTSSHHTFIGVWDNANEDKGGATGVADIGPPGMQRRDLKVTGGMYIGMYSCPGAAPALMSDAEPSRFVNGTCLETIDEWKTAHDVYPDVYDAKDLGHTLDQKSQQQGTNLFIRGNLQARDP